jgi:glycosyltransferase involved in cell wall biosynthesis
VRVLITTHHRLERNLGAPGAALALGEALRDLGHDVRWLSWDDMPSALGARARELLFPEFVAARLLRARGWRPAVVDATTGDAWLWGLLRRGGRPALVTRSHGLEHVFYAELEREARAGRHQLSLLTRLYHGRVRLWEVTGSLRRSDLCLFANPQDLDRAVERLGVERARAALFANGVPDAFLEATRQGLPAGDPPRLAVVGSWTARKGIEYGAPALAAVLERHRDVAVTCVGSGAPAAEVHRHLPPALRERIGVVPSYERRELPALLRGHQVLFMPSLAEGQSMALLEGMACGLAPVTTPAGAAHIARDGHDALVVPARDPDALAAAVERLLADPDLLQRLREAAAGTAREHSWSRIARDTLSLYEQAIV